jgi:general stress protein 26
MADESGQAPELEQVVEETIVEQMKPGDVVIEAKRLGIWTYVATVSATGRPYVTPVHPGWEGETLWIMIELASVKAKNVAANPQVSCHWPVSEDTDMDSLMLWGTGRIYDDIETKRRLWDGVFDYDLGMWAPGGVENCPDKGFLEVIPTKALLLRFYGAKGRAEWQA